MLRYTMVYKAFCVCLSATQNGHTTQIVSANPSVLWEVSVP